MCNQAVHVGNTPETSHPEYGLDQAPAEYIEKYAWVSNEMRRNLSAMVSVMDEAAGNVTASLKKAGMWEDTLFIFSTDVRFPLAALTSATLSCSHGWLPSCRVEHCITNSQTCDPNADADRPCRTAALPTTWHPTTPCLVARYAASSSFCRCLPGHNVGARLHYNANKCVTSSLDRGHSGKVACGELGL